MLCTTLFWNDDGPEWLGGGKRSVWWNWWNWWPQGVAKKETNEVKQKENRIWCDKMNSLEKALNKLCFPETEWTSGRSGAWEGSSSKFVRCCWAVCQTSFCQDWRTRYVPLRPFGGWSTPQGCDRHSLWCRQDRHKLYGKETSTGEEGALVSVPKWHYSNTASCMR